jgi:hypothetical protein
MATVDDLRKEGAVLEAQITRIIKTMPEHPSDEYQFPWACGNREYLPYIKWIESMGRVDTWVKLTVKTGGHELKFHFTEGAGNFVLALDGNTIVPDTMGLQRIDEGLADSVLAKIKAFTADLMTCEGAPKVAGAAASPDLKNVIAALDAF